ncbi:MAG: helix-turn-helix domain-containing protein [Pseudomonadota bacterium]
MARGSFREQVLIARERAIVEAVNRLLAEKGFEAMTVDAVAAEVGIAKASLYKHFKSKEDLAAAAMIGVLDRALELIETLQRDAATSARERLEAVTRWAMQAQLAGEMPSLPAQNSALRSALMANRDYLDRVMQVSDLLGEWILAAQAAGDLDPALPPEVILYTIYARACDPVSGVLKASANFTDERIVELLLSTCFRGLAGAPAAAG